MSQPLKSWSSANIACGRITGVFGTNSSGKTSLLQFILALKQTKDTSDRATALDLNGDYVKLGTMHDVIHRHNEDQAIEWMASFELASDLSLSNPNEKRASLISKSRNLKIKSSVTMQKTGPVSQNLAYRLGDVEFSLAPKENSNSQFELQSKWLTHKEAA